jgi:hypothetical protein
MNYDDYQALLIETVRQNLGPGESAVTAAAVGMYMRAAAPDVNYRAFGKRSLLVILQELEQAGRVRLVKTAKGALAVEPTEKAGTPATQPAARAQASTPSFNPLHVAVWNAFVMGAPVGRRFMHRTTGALRSGLEFPPSPADEWVEIQPIPLEAQREWATRFLAEEAGDHAPQLRSALAEPGWHPRVFLSTLKTVSEGLARRWNLFRSQQVSTHVQAWLDRYAVAHHLAFNSPARSVSVEPTVDTGDAGREATRRAILAALETLPLDQLLDLRLPAGAMWAALQASRR